MKATEENGNIYSILAKTEKIPLDAIVTAPHVATSLSNNIQNILLSLTPESSQIKEMRTAGWPYAGVVLKKVT